MSEPTLCTPPTEAEVSEVIVALPEPWKSTVRRLAFERDILKSEKDGPLSWRNSYKDAMRTIWCLLESAGGEIAVSDKTLCQWREQDCRIESRLDPDNRCTVMRSTMEEPE